MTILMGLAVPTSNRHHPCIPHTSQMRNIPLPRGKIVDIESAEMIVPAGAREDLHEVDRGLEEIRQLPR